MAIERVGSTITINITTPDRENNQEITVPATAQIAVATFCAYRSNPDWYNNPIFTLGGDAMTQQCRVVYETSGDWSAVAIETLLNPSTGTQTFAWDYSDTYYADRGIVVHIVFYAGIDTSAPIADADITKNGNDITGMSYSTGDMMFGCAISFEATISVSESGQTEIANPAIYNHIYSAIAEKLSTGDFDTSGGDYVSVAAIVIAAAPEPTTYTGGITEGFTFGTGGSGGSDGAGGLNYTQFFAAAPGQRVYRYYAKLSAQTFPTAQDEYDLGGIASIQLNMESTWAWWWGRPSRLVISIPYSQEKINAIALRPMADIVLEMAVVIDGVEVQRETIITVDFTSVATEQTPDDSTITINGIRRIWNNSNLVELAGVVSRSVQEDGRVQFRCAQPDWRIRPGNRVDDDGDVIMIGTVTWSVTPMAQSMDLTETRYPWEWY